MSKFFVNHRKPQRQGKTITVGKIEDLPVGRGATIQLKDGSELALFNASGNFFAIENHCPHRGYPLADSRVYGNIVECDVHGWQFNLQNGDCLTEPTCPLETYEVKIEDGLIKILV